MSKDGRKDKRSSVDRPKESTTENDRSQPDLKQDQIPEIDLDRIRRRVDELEAQSNQLDPANSQEDTRRKKVKRKLAKRRRGQKASSGSQARGRAQSDATSPNQLKPAIDLSKSNSNQDTQQTKTDQIPPAQSQQTKDQLSKIKRRKTQETHEPNQLHLSLGEKFGFALNIILQVSKKLIGYVLVIALLVAALAAGTGIGYFANLVQETEAPSPESMAQDIHRLEQQSSLYYASGELISTVRADVVRSVVDMDQVSDLIIDGFIATEDENFYEHPGIMPKAIIRAALETILTGSGTGGSTITQQLVKQQILSNEVTFHRKANEILMALRLENFMGKDEILEAYLNVSPFGRNNKGENIAGIEQASLGIFGLAPDEVNLNQAAFLVGLPQDPYRYTPYDQYGNLYEDNSAGIARMREVLFRMYRNQAISREEYDQALNYDITKDFIASQEREEEQNSYLYQAIMHGAILEIMKINVADDNLSWQEVNLDVDRYNDYYYEAEEQVRNGGYKVYSTIDREIYDLLQESALAYSGELGVSYDGIYVDPDTGYETYYVENVQTGVVVIENESGKVLGFVAGTDFENNQIDHAFQMHRSPGSTIKPLAVYAPAIEHNLITPATIIPDTPFVQEFEDGTVWAPTNYGNYVSGGNMSARTALLKSDNLPAVRIYEELLNRRVPIIDYLDKMGFDLIDSYTEEDTLNLAFSLGGVTTGPTVFEETRAFTTFANNGYYVDGYYIERIEDAYGNVVYQHNEEAVKVFSEDTNYLIIDILRDTMTEGTGRTANEYLLAPGDWIAKTGISENSKDIWVLASTPAITIGSWIGYDSRYADYTIDVNDGYGLESVRSQIYWARIVNDLYELRPDIFGSELVFAQPSSVIEQDVLEQTGTLAGTINLNGRQVSLTQPLRNDLFKVSNPAPALTYNFLFGATEDEQAQFWNSLFQQQEAIRRQREAQILEQTSEETSESTSLDPNNPNQTLPGQAPPVIYENAYTVPPLDANTSIEGDQGNSGW